MGNAWFLDDCAIETRLARRVNGRLAGVWHFPKIVVPPRARLGEVYLARVGKRRPGAGGIFLDLGAAGEGYLREPTAKLPPEGALALVTVVQEAVGEKAPRLALGARLQGRAGKLVWSEHRQRAEGGETNEQALMQSELDAVLRKVNAAGPALMNGAPSAARRLAGAAAHKDRILVVGPGLLADVRSELAKWAPGLAVDITPSTPALFEDEGIEGAIEAALEPVVSLSAGGRLIIETTRALTAIDVDSGAGRPATANEEAARAIPYEIAVRGLAGTIVVDFAQVRDRSALSRLGAMIAEVAEHLGLPLEIGTGRRGLLDLRRPRAEAPLASTLTRAGQTHLSVAPVLTLSAQSARIARAIGRARPASRIEVRIPKATYDWWHGEGRAFRDAIIAAVPARLAFAIGDFAAPDAFELAA